MYIISITSKTHKKLYLYSTNKYCLICVDKMYKSKFFNNLKNIKKFKRKINRVYGNKYYRNISIIKLNLFQKICRIVYNTIYNFKPINKTFLNSNITTIFK